MPPHNHHIESLRSLPICCNIWILCGGEVISSVANTTTISLSLSLSLSTQATLAAQVSSTREEEEADLPTAVFLFQKSPSCRRWRERERPFLPFPPLPQLPIDPTRPNVKLNKGPDVGHSIGIAQYMYNLLTCLKALMWYLIKKKEIYDI